MTTNKETVEKWRKAHHAALEQLANNKTPGLTLWRKLRRIENQAHNAATAQCNGEAFNGEPFRDEDEWERFKAGITHSVELVMGWVPAGFFINGDPRGYALKIESAEMPAGMHKDWGGYGILAPVIE